MALTDAKRRANNKYLKEHYTTLGCKVRKDVADKFRDACKANRTTPNAIFSAAMKSYIDEHEKQKESRQEAAEKVKGEAGVLGMILGAGGGKTEE